MLRIIRITLLIALIALISAITANQLVYTTSEQAFVNTRLTSLSADISGKVSRCFISTGNLVRKGDPLLKIFNPRYSNNNLQVEKYRLISSIGSLQEDIRQSGLTLVKMRADHARREQLRGTGSIAEADLDNSARDLMIFKTEFINQHLKLGRSVRMLRHLTSQIRGLREVDVKAPTDGVVWAVLTKNGEYVQEGTALLNIISADNLWVDAFFNEQSASRLKPGMEVSVQEIGSSRTWKGTITHIRGGSGRISYNTTVEIPPSSLSHRLVAVQIRVDWKNAYSPQEFFGAGRSMIVKHSNYHK